MTIDVSSFVDGIVNLVPNVAANVKKGISTSTALFAGLENGQVNASTLINNQSLPANVRANINSFLGSSPNLLSNAGSFLSNTVGNVSAATGQQFKKKNSNIGIDEAKKQTFDKGAPKILLDQADVPIGIPIKKIKEDIPTLLQSEVKALMLQLAYISSNYDTTYNENSRLGRYGVHYKTLKNYGYVSSDNTTWTGKDGINGEVDFLFDNNIQDKIMEQYITDQYAALVKAEALRSGDSKETVAGMLAVSYQFQDANVSPGAASSLALNSISSLSSGLTGALDTNINNITSSLGQSLSVAENNSIMKTGAESLGATLQSVNLESTLSGATTALNSTIGNLPTNASAADIQNLGDKLKNVNSSTLGLDPSLNSSRESLTAVAPQLKAQFENLAPSLTSSLNQSNIKNLKVDVSSLRKSTSDFNSSIPAHQAKEWRSTGKEKDSQGRPGSLFFNAGRYALTVLSAD